MKVSLKVREERRPVVRAKLPLNVLGLPVFTGITSGDRDELAIHLGTDVGAGPAFRISYKPNNLLSPFSVLVKTGFGLWGSPNGAAMAMSAEFDLNSSGPPSFSVRLKPKFGDFGFRKDSPRFKASYEQAPRAIEDDAERMVAIDSVEQTKPEAVEVAAVSIREADSPNVTPNVKEMDLPNGILEGSDHSENEKEKGLSEQPSTSHDEGAAADDDQVVDSYKSLNVGVVSSRHGEKLTVATRGRPRLGAAAIKGWKFNAHSRLPLGNWAVAKVRWQIKMGSDLFQDLRQGLYITDIEMPSLAVEKISFEALNPRRHRRSSPEQDLINGFGFGYDDNSKLGRIFTMCDSMRYQIQLLHLENKLLKNTIDEWGRELPSGRRSASKGTPLLLPEESPLGSTKLFDDRNGKSNGGSNGHGKNGGSNGKTRDGRHSEGGSQNGKGTSSTGEEFTLNTDVSAELQKAIMNAGGGGF